MRYLLAILLFSISFLASPQKDMKRVLPSLGVIYCDISQDSPYGKEQWKRYGKIWEIGAILVVVRSNRIIEKDGREFVLDKIFVSPGVEYNDESIAKVCEEAYSYFEEIPVWRRIYLSIDGKYRVMIRLK